MTVPEDTGKYLAISGGVGGAKLVLGLSRLLSPAQLAIVTNTGDDFDHLGLRICPDLDTVMYTLADLNNKEQGWGLAGESWNFLAALKKFGGEAWFQLGDRDLATHMMRTHLLHSGKSLSAVTRELCRHLSVEHDIFPMSDSQVSTLVKLKNGETLPFQHYFVRDRCEPEVNGFEFKGIEQAQASAGFEACLNDPDLKAVIICPSNPFVSVDPVLAVPGVRNRLREVAAPVIAISPIVGGKALKGPTAKMMQELDMPRSAVSVAYHYQGLLDGYVLDSVDAQLRPQLEDLGIATITTSTVMITLEDRIQLAADTLSFARTLASGSG